VSRTGEPARGSTGLAPLELLYEQAGLPAFELPAELQDLYGGSGGFAEPRLYANFVAAIDGVVAIPRLAASNQLISGGSDADRFVMGLLRACADVVLIGSGTLRGSPRTLWTPAHAYPPAAAAFAELRRRRGRPPRPALAVLSASGGVEANHPALRAGASVLATARGAAALRGRLPAATSVLVVRGDATVDVGDAVDCLHDLGHRLVLSEAGPHVFGSLLDAGRVDELFLTSSPVVAGRPAGSAHLGLVEGAQLLPDRHVEGRLMSVRRSGSHLFLRYAIR